MAERPESYGPEPGEIDDVYLPLLPVYVDTEASYGLAAFDFGLVYTPLGAILGVQDEDEVTGRPGRRCFNCGSQNHALNDCPERRDHELIDLSRQMFEFYRPEVSSRSRIHEVEEWRKIRTEWLETFEPGQIKGDLLREALWLRDDDSGENVEWLRNIAIWGYPKGWTGSEDPRMRVWRRIMNEEESDEALNTPTKFTIFGDGEETEVILPLDAPKFQALAPEPDEESDASSVTLSDDSSIVEVDHPDHPPSDHRWVKYPNSYFLYTKLPIYNGMALPSVRHEESLAYPGPSAWRVPMNNSAPPPQPSIPPPPLPPSPVLPPPPLPLPAKSAVSVTGSSQNPIEILDGNSDMEFSDSD